MGPKQYLHSWGRVVIDPKGVCNQWNPTSSGETHGDVLIRNDFP